MFEINLLDWWWINKTEDDPDDLCLHGVAVARIGDARLSDECGVSASALNLLKSLQSDHIAGQGNQMMPCCGHFWMPNEAKDTVEILGCPYGTDWTVRHEGGQVRIITEADTQAVLDMPAYKAAVFRYADQVRAVHARCAPKRLPEDAFIRDGHLAFWREWERLRAL